MTLLKTRIFVSAAVFAANLALSLAYGGAQAHAPHHEARSRALQAQVPSATRAFGDPAPKHEMSMRADDFSGFCGFSGANAC